MSAEHAGTGGGAEAKPARRRRLSMAEQARISARVSANETLAELVMERVGGSHVKAMHVLGFIAAYGIFVEQNGFEPRTPSQLARSGKSKRSAATIDRWGAVFKEAFPEYAMPTLLWSIARAQLPFLDDEDVVSLQLGAVQL